MNDFESWLADELKARASGVEGSASMAGAARKQARTIRTRRIVTGGAIAAVVAAVAIPTAMSLTGNPLSGPEPATTTTPVTDSPSPAPTETPSEEPTTPPSDPATEPETPPTETDEPEQPERGGTTELVLDGLSEGDAPAIGWTDGRTFHHPDGGEITLPESMFDPIAYGGAVYGSYLGEQAEGTMLLWADGESSVIQGSAPIVSTSGSSIGWFDTGTHRLTVFDSPGEGVVPLEADGPDEGTLQPVGFLGDAVVVSNVFSTDGQHLGVRIDDLSGDGEPVQTPDWGTLEVTTVSEAAQLVAGYTEFGDDGTACSAVYEVEGTAPLWDTCDYSFDHFSPDGRFIVGAHAYRDGIGDAYAVVLDAHTGEVVHTFEAPEGGFVTNTAFEDDTHVLIVLATGDPGETAITRCEFEGACETTTDIREFDTIAGDGLAPFGLGRQP